MDPSIQSIQILQSIVTQYGPPSESNLKMYRGLLHDLLVDQTRELNLLKITLEQGQVFKLIRESKTVPFEMLLQQIVNHLHSSFGMDTNAARWAIETWAEALGIHLIHSCIADFNASPIHGPAPLSVTFSNTSKGDVTRFEWDFGDGDGSTERDPVHVFRAPGTYTTILRAFRDSFISEKKAADVIIAEWPELKAEITSVPSEGEVFLAIQFTSHCQGLVQSFNWDFGDGEHSSEKNPIHEYAKVGIYQVSLTVSDGNSSITATLSKPISVTPEKLRADFSFSAPDNENPLSLQFIDTSKGEKTSYLWDFGDGSGSDVQNPLHWFDVPGIFQVRLTVTDLKTGSTNTVVKKISTEMPPPEAVFTQDVSEGVAPLSVQFTNVSIGYISNFEWDFGDGTTSTDENPAHIYEKPGRYSVHLVVSNGVDSSKSLKNFAVIVKPSNLFADFIVETKTGFIPLKTSFTPKCSNLAASYHWTFGDGKESCEQNPHHVYNDVGTFSVTLRITLDGFTEEEKQKNLIEVKPILSSLSQTEESSPNQIINPLVEGEKVHSEPSSKFEKNNKPSTIQKTPDVSQLNNDDVPKIAFGILGLGIIIAIIFFSMGAGSSTGSSSHVQTSSPSSSADLNDKGVALYNLGKYYDAIGIFEQALKINPNDATIWTNQGHAQYSLGKTDEALKSYDQALKINPQYSDAINWRKKCVEPVQTITPPPVTYSDDPQALKSQGNSLYMQNKYEEALIAFNKALKFNPEDAQMWAMKGNTLYYLGKYDEAIKAFSEAIRIDPKISSEVKEKKKRSAEILQKLNN